MRKIFAETIDKAVEQVNLYYSRIQELKAAHGDKMNLLQMDCFNEQKENYEHACEYLRGMVDLLDGTEDRVYVNWRSTAYKSEIKEWSFVNYVEAR